LRSAAVLSYRRASQEGRPSAPALIQNQIREFQNRFNQAEFRSDRLQSARESIGKVEIRGWPPHSAKEKLEPFAFDPGPLGPGKVEVAVFVLDAAFG
jgi:hypothetical protein